MKWTIFLIAASAAMPQEATPLRLRAYPQKIVTFHDAADPAVPKQLSSHPPRTPLPSIVCQLKTTDGAVWTGTRQGLIRFQPAAQEPDRLQYFAGRRYLPDDEVLNLAAGQTGGVWVRTRAGVSYIRFVPMTLAQKAAHFEQRIEQRHDRYGLVASSNLLRPGDLASNRLDPSDNDGLWTAMYAAAECFRYAVTRSPVALARARRSTEAVLFLEQVTGRPGFPARSYIRRGDWRVPGGVWHWTPDGEFEWKADTSSDEIVGHFYLFGIAWDLLPDPDLRGRIAATAARIADHILHHGLNLTDIHGQPTYWGRWSQEYFETPRGAPDAPLNALELLSLLKTAHHLTGESRFDAAYRKVAYDMKYAEMTARLLELRRVVNYSDEELVEVLIRAKSELIPPYCRISRLIRDIPSTSIAAGNDITNLREFLQKKMKEGGLTCKCLRCREVGHVAPELRTRKPKLFDLSYEASGGEEHFLSFEDDAKEVVFAFCRLRLPSEVTLPELEGCAFIRELHTYGHLVPIDAKNISASQHKGMGKKLMARAEEIAREAGFKKMAVISGIGVRDYYRKLGYRLQGTYMVKSL